MHAGVAKFDLSNMPYSRRQKMLVSNSTDEEKEKKFNLMKMESKNIRGWWKVCYYNKRTSEWIESVRCKTLL